MSVSGLCAEEARVLRREGGSRAGGDLGLREAPLCSWKNEHEPVGHRVRRELVSLLVLRAGEREEVRQRGAVAVHQSAETAGPAALHRGAVVHPGAGVPDPVQAHQEAGAAAPPAVLRLQQHAHHQRRAAQAGRRAD